VPTRKSGPTVPWAVIRRVRAITDFFVSAGEGAVNFLLAGVNITLLLARSNARMSAAEQALTPP
jgi:hypothetical protein